jgi:hypothetical protein
VTVTSGTLVRRSTTGRSRNGHLPAPNPGRGRLPDRIHYLLEGAVTAVGGFTYPGEDGWRNPDLVWPDDRRWFVATDIDVWSLFVAGTPALTDEVAGAVLTFASRVDPADALPIED